MLFFQGTEVQRQHCLKVKGQLPPFECGRFLSETDLLNCRKAFRRLQEIIFALDLGILEPWGENTASLMVVD